jgi:hypothetical protein
VARIYSVNQTLAFRVVLGPVLRLYKLVRNEGGKLLAGDFSHLRIWAVHALSVAPVLYFVTASAAWASASTCCTSSTRA